MSVVHFLDVVWEWMARWTVEMPRTDDDGSDALFSATSVIAISLDSVRDSVS